MDYVSLYDTVNGIMSKRAFLQKEASKGKLRIQRNRWDKRNTQIVRDLLLSHPTKAVTIDEARKALKEAAGARMYDEKKFRKWLDKFNAGNVRSWSDPSIRSPFKASGMGDLLNVDASGLYRKPVGKPRFDLPRNKMNYPAVVEAASSAGPAISEETASALKRAVKPSGSFLRRLTKYLPSKDFMLGAGAGTLGTAAGYEMFGDSDGEKA